MDFNRIKDLLKELAKSNGLILTDLEEQDPATGLFSWSIDWNRDLSQSFQIDMKNLQASLDLYEDALAKNDLLAVKAGLTRAGVYAHQLSNLFYAFKEDLRKVCIDPRFNWPELPEDYRVPGY